MFPICHRDDEIPPDTSRLPSLLRSQSPAEEIPISTGPLVVQASESRQVWVNTATGIITTPERGGTERPSKANSCQKQMPRPKGSRPTMGKLAASRVDFS
jgi:hypothetical protein